MESDVTQSASFYKVWGWFETNKKQVTWGAALVVIVGLIVYFLVWQHNEKEIAAGQALSKVFVPQATGMVPRDNPDGYLKVAAEYPKSPAGAQALLLGAGALFTEGKYAEAYQQFEKFTREHHDSPLLGGALLGVAACLEAQGKTNEALTAYKNLVDFHSTEPVVPQARFALGRLYEAQNKPELARTQYEEVARSDPYGSLGNEAAMRLEELKQKFPNLAPSAPVAPSLPAMVQPGTNAPGKAPSATNPAAAPKLQKK